MASGLVPKTTKILVGVDCVMVARSKDCSCFSLAGLCCAVVLIGFNHHAVGSSAEVAANGAPKNLLGVAG